MSCIYSTIRRIPTPVITLDQSKCTKPEGRDFQKREYRKKMKGKENGSWKTSLEHRFSAIFHDVCDLRKFRISLLVFPANSAYSYWYHTLNPQTSQITRLYFYIMAHVRRRAPCFTSNNVEWYLTSLLWKSNTWTSFPFHKDSSGVWV